MKKLLLLILVGLTILIAGCTTQTGQITKTSEESSCNPNWQCSSWSECSSTDIQTRTCTDLNNCGTVSEKPTESQSCTPSVMEFPALTLCKRTGGTWKAVSTEQYPVNESEGVYNPTTNSEINYKCFCPIGKSWNPEGGCK